MSSNSTERPHALLKRLSSSATCDAVHNKVIAKQLKAVVLYSHCSRGFAGELAGWRLERLPFPFVHKPGNITGESEAQAHGVPPVVFATSTSISTSYIYTQTTACYANCKPKQMCSNILMFILLRFAMLFIFIPPCFGWLVFRFLLTLPR